MLEVAISRSLQMNAGCVLCGCKGLRDIENEGPVFCKMALKLFITIQFRSEPGTIHRFDSDSSVGVNGPNSPDKNALLLQ